MSSIIQQYLPVISSVVKRLRYIWHPAHAKGERCIILINLKEQKVEISASSEQKLSIELDASTQNLRETYDIRNELVIMIIGDGQAMSFKILQPRE